MNTATSDMRLKLWSAEFTLAIGCQVACEYCPQGKLISKYNKLFPGADKIMKIETFKKILTQIEPGAGLSITGMAEPFQNPNCSKMIKYAYEKGYRVHLATTLQGATLEDVEILKDVEFLSIRLHIPDGENNSHFRITDEWLEVFKRINERKEVNVYQSHGITADVIKPYLRTDLPLYEGGLMNRAGNLTKPELKTYNHKGRIVCESGGKDSFGSWIPEILPNGAILLCCMDYGMEHILGNILTQEWEDIVTSAEYKKIECGMNDDTIQTLCRKCPSARRRDESKAVSYINLLGPNATRAWRLFQTNDVNLSMNPREKDIVKRIKSAKHICIFGLGKLFRDNYFQAGWYKAIQADIFTDSDETKWDKNISGVHCTPPPAINTLDDVLVITYVADDSAIVEYLNRNKITNVINIYDIYNMGDY